MSDWHQRAGLMLLAGTLLAGSGLPCWTVVAADAPATSTSEDREAALDPATELRLLERKVLQTVQQVQPSVVAVSGGSGVVVSEDGYVVTVAHVGRRAGREVTVTFPDGTKASGKTLGNDHGVDAGLIKLDGDGPWPYAELGSSADLQRGQWCLAMGYPISFERGKPPVVRIGRVQRNRSTVIVTDCLIMGGDSGGPLFDLEGRVIGIGSRCSHRLDINISVPIDKYRNQWERLAGGEDFNSRIRSIAFLGVAPDEQTEHAAVGRVLPGTAAEEAGLSVGDIILKFDGTALERYAELPPLIRSRRPGDEVELEIRRGEQTLTLKVTLGRRDIERSTRS